MMNETRVESKFPTDPCFRPASKAQESKEGGSERNPDVTSN